MSLRRERLSILVELSDDWILVILIQILNLIIVVGGLGSLISHLSNGKWCGWLLSLIRKVEYALCVLILGGKVLSYWSILHCALTLVLHNHELVIDAYQLMRSLLWRHLSRVNDSCKFSVWKDSYLSILCSDLVEYLIGEKVYCLIQTL